MATSATSLETIIVSDLHLADAQPVDPRRPYWKAYKQARFFIDRDFAKLLEHVLERATGPVELICNGDTFDFDSITSLPKALPGPTSWLSRARGLSSEEWMSLYKVDVIIDHHPEWFGALREIVSRGHFVVFIVGNHDVELHWPSVQSRILEALDLPEDDLARVRFCNSFYISGKDTFVSHGHIFDPYCAEKNPIDPLILMHGRPRVRIPFGDMANRYMLNGMGYFNPHANENFIMSAREYVSFFFRFIFLRQPLLLVTWFWSAVATLFLVLRDFWTPAMRDPLLVEEKTQAIADRSNATPAMVRSLAALHVPSAATSPFKIIRTLWLDRGALFLAVLFGAWQLMLTINFVWPISPWWILLFLALLFPGFVFYSARVKSPIQHDMLLTDQSAELIAKITGTTQAVFGHTHVPRVKQFGSFRYVNGGFWSPAFKEPTCETRIGTQTFVWLRPSTTNEVRQAQLYEWPPNGDAPRPYDESTAGAEAAPALDDARGART